ncbi:efflux RND transporter periplasmic adaptor subunit [Bordetella genomosp. 1]|nr:efflux RND transporter periplasmic adaptor subunit [Bordetella genomosp. 1]
MVLSAQMAQPSYAGPSRHRRLVHAALLVLVVLGLWFWWRAPGSPKPPGRAQQPVPVEVARVRAAPLQLQLHALGTVTPLTQVLLRPQVDGELLRLHYAEGQTVAAGDLLAEVDARPFRLALAQAEGRLAQTRAQLDNARADLGRFEALARRDSVARQQLDGARTAVERLSGQLARDRAGVDEAERRLSHTRIVAPLTGRIGLRRIDAGNHVRAADATGLATLVQMSPISVMFSVPDSRLDLLRQALGRAGTLEVEAWDADDRRVVARGALTALDNRIAAGSGTVRLRAHFDNAAGTLFPNQFVNIRVTLVQEDQSLTVPAASVQYGAEGPYAYVIDAEDKARRKPIAVGLASGGRIAVTDGLAAGERVVVEGVDRLNEGRATRVLAEQEPQS